MAIDALVKPLLALPLFQGLTPLQLTEIVRRAERIIYRPGDAIIAEDEPSDAAIVIVSGTSVRINDHRDVPQKSRGETLPEGVMIAELAMFIELVHTTTVIAQSQVKALRLTRQKMHELMEEDAGLARHFSSCITTRLKLLAHDMKAVDTIMERAAIAPQLPQVRPNLPVDAHPG
ncbi:cyclic nucleotide-binding domain-containing protein [Hyphomicrobium sp. ghe19]|uniref:cyclic nucleotide-binding domain-containing protein n=1 Tax=Hyphomicrobium sp. ghe19 TaxID=2682968 RepID=UPI001366888A|nr:hypothetical protein HYPP_04173 [Hyphomicrobium sp. ghe19]